MENENKLIARRLKGLREIMDVSVEEAGKVCGISPDDYLKYESGEKDIPVSILHSMAKAYNFELTALLSGEEPLMHSYSLTRKGRGISVERRKDYMYQSLACSFRGRKAEPFIVTVEPDGKEGISFNSHHGQEFNYVLEGKLMIVIDRKELVLEEGDSLYFDSTLPHGMKALDGKRAKFLAVIF